MYIHCTAQRVWSAASCGINQPSLRNQKSEISSPQQVVLDSASLGWVSPAPQAVKTPLPNFWHSFRRGERGNICFDLT